MTTQVPEKIFYNGTMFSTLSEPLRGYLKENVVEFASQSSACWRGYIGHWVIENQQLYLAQISSYRKPRKGLEPSIESLFSTSGRVLASWFDGQIRLETGASIGYHGHGHYFRDTRVILSFSKGRLIHFEHIHHLA